MACTRLIKRRPPRTGPVPLIWGIWEASLTRGDGIQSRASIQAALSPALMTIAPPQPAECLSYGTPAPYLRDNAPPEGSPTGDQPLPLLSLIPAI